MSEQNPYEQLGVTESSSFDEIQAAKNRLFAEFEGDAEQLKVIEAAYDAVLMDRLKMRQEGKIKVPDGIRFAERKVEPAPSTSPTSKTQKPAWLERLIDTPSQVDIWQSAGVMSALVAIAIFVPTAVQLTLILGVGSTFYFLFRKERKFGRSILLSFAGLILGLILGGLIFGGLAPYLPGVALTMEAFASAITFILLWAVSSFLR